VYELNYARKMHQSSALRSRLKLCAVVGQKPFADSDIRALALAMQEPYYEYIGERPLVYLFNGERPDFVGRLRAICREVGTPDPYCAAMYGRVPAGASYPAVEALSAYACCKSGIDTYAELSADCIAKNELRYAAGMPTIPQYTTGWAPGPRLDSPAPWCGYPYENYAKFASEEELLDGAKALADWMNSKPADSFIGHMLAFAWNEFEEGGMICPTYNEDGVTINDSRLKAFRKAADYLRANVK
jgi:hypothetical protein